jgi:hypothetical protein
MREFVSKHLKVIVAIVVTFVVATAIPSLGAGGFDAHNARKVGGHTLDQLSSTTYLRVKAQLNDFDGCRFRDILRRKVRVPAPGYLTVSSMVGAARQTGDDGEGLLVTRLLVGGKIVSNESAVNLENDGLLDATNVNQGVARVKKGLRTVRIAARECGPGAAFIVSRQLVTQFSPTGAIRR